MEIGYSALDRSSSSSPIFVFSDKTPNTSTSATYVRFPFLTGEMCFIFSPLRRIAFKRKNADGKMCALMAARFGGLAFLRLFRWTTKSDETNSFGQKRLNRSWVAQNSDATKTVSCISCLKSTYARGTLVLQYCYDTYSIHLCTRTAREATATKRSRL